MAKNWAIAIGINKYRNLQPLQFAKQDAEVMYDFFIKAGFDEHGIFLFTDDSPEIETQSVPIPTNPTYGTIRRFLRAQFEKPLLQTGDNLWFSLLDTVSNMKGETISCFQIAIQGT